MVPPGPAFDAALRVIRAAADDAGRDPEALGIEGRINVGDGDLDRIARAADGWRALGRVRVVLNTLNAGLGSIDAHLEALGRAVDCLAR
jgi:hypothetical protein